ncbi:MAG: hypothetical protein COW24_04950 [Candidatus Kerfeldbacteria bacterium CG15_BIG_FIL_POST_REV_8_21_14_020_45_12]|uniref:Glycosyl hydrolase family 32 N-terminal domain-containing protein n=1 Tax=Candidatus Kerfeldbacteria bacterium CG15_BIG_FIL_POST_REV_8_21_14_020_45_12 TaxID=2014247 RepID=A0A2M7H2R8_9BACT|nr:MAG: hypothetical protein COW24_04950 [Candidatus Kerfeldbacteria bacterium CG15_BIG_FIL_POST_REV_8_21_14_020_45_12]PJA93236.1 MAG: hypothetical protein CO132_03965 [Candidatus Kerfeldbacteria bacterium CG_4_9_14_3_um_filter_45_8]
MRQLQTILAILVVMVILGLIIVYNPFGLAGFSKHDQASYIILQPNPGPNWDAKKVTSPSVLYDSNAGLYKMWYVGNGVFERAGIGYAESPDGVTWSVSSASPVLEGRLIDPTLNQSLSWEDGGFRAVSVIHDGNLYKMWYAAEEYAEPKRMQIGYAESTDGIKWSKHSGNPVVTFDSAGSWDTHSVSEPFVIKEGNSYKMWYTGYPANTDGSRAGISAIGYAESTNGKDWRRPQGVPVLQSKKKAWDSVRVSGPSIISYNNGTGYEMWFSGETSQGRSQLGRAYSADGKAWVEDEQNPLVQDDRDDFFDPFVVEVNKQYYLWLTRHNSKNALEFSIEYTTWPMDDPADTQYIPSRIPHN